MEFLTKKLVFTVFCLWFPFPPIHPLPLPASRHNWDSSLSLFLTDDVEVGPVSTGVHIVDVEEWKHGGLAGLSCYRSWRQMTEVAAANFSRSSFLVRSILLLITMELCENKPECWSDANVSREKYKLAVFQWKHPVTIFGLYIGMYAPRIVALKTFYLMNISFRPLHLVSSFISGNILQRSYGELVIWKGGTPNC